MNISICNVSLIRTKKIIPHTYMWLSGYMGKPQKQITSYY